MNTTSTGSYTQLGEMASVTAQMQRVLQGRRTVPID